MTKKLRNIFIFILTIWTKGIFASPQMPDYIIYGKDTIATYNLILENYMQRLDTPKIDKLFGLSFRDPSSLSSSTGCWRGYQAVYKIENDSLFLVDILNCDELENGEINKVRSAEKIKAMFGCRFIGGRVFINWFSGSISFPLTNEVLRWDGVFYKIYEKEKVFDISNGLITKVEDVDNYIDDPKRIDRRDVSKISNLLFKKLKRIKWKNINVFDCSYAYLVTIDENGNISKVRTQYSNEKIEKDCEENRFCTNIIFNALKSLKFEIIKDKGKPISDDIYIEIWIEDDCKIENWTH